MPWADWEDYAAGLYATTTTTPEHVQTAAALLADPETFRETAREMVREWPNAAIHNLRHMWTGRRAWVGQATCCYSNGIPAATTRLAWGTLANDTQRSANQTADLVIAEWERTRGAETLFGV